MANAGERPGTGTRTRTRRGGGGGVPYNSWDPGCGRTPALHTSWTHYTQVSTRPHLRDQ